MSKKVWLLMATAQSGLSVTAIQEHAVTDSVRVVILSSAEAGKLEVQVQISGFWKSGGGGWTFEPFRDVRRCPLPWLFHWKFQLRRES